MIFLASATLFLMGSAGRLSLVGRKTVVLVMKTAAMIENREADSLEKPFATRF